MGRPKRLQFPGACYYIILQGNNRQDIFVSNQDRRYFLSMARSYKERYGLKIYAYCLMSRDVHVLLETSQANLSVVMQGFSTLYTKYFNAQHNTVGHLFQGRYKALLVDKEACLAEVSAHIHLQAVRSGQKGKPWRYQWSSCSAYVESGERGPLIDSEAVLAHFGKLRIKQSVRYLQYIKDRMTAQIQPVLPVVAGLAVGSAEFLSKALEKAGAPPAPAGVAEGIGEARRILAEVAARHGIDEEKLVGRVQWREVSLVRRKAVHRIWKEARMGVTELARLFNRTPSAISQMIRAMEPPLGR